MYSFKMRWLLQRVTYSNVIDSLLHVDHLHWVCYLVVHVVGDHVAASCHELNRIV